MIEKILDGEKLLIAVKGRMINISDPLMMLMFIKTLSKKQIIDMIDDIDDKGMSKSREG